MQVVLAEFYGFEYSLAVKIFMVGFALLGLAAALMVRLSVTQWLIAAMLFAVSLSAPLNEDRTGYLPTWMLPVQQYKASIHLTLGLILSALVLFSGKAHMHYVPVQGLFILAISLYAGFLQFFHEDAGSALESIGFCMAVVPCMLFAAPAACRDYEGCIKTVRMIMVVGAAWAVCSSIQFVVNPRLVVNGAAEGARFWGMMGNAQGAAIFCAPMVVIGIWLWLNDPRRRLKILWVALIAINLLFTAWTGSRTGVVMLVLGGAFVLYSRIGRFVLFLPVTGLVVWGLSFLSDELQIQSNLDRLTSMQDTRKEAWAAQLRSIAESPLVGVGWNDVGASESSWLGGFAGYGVIMFLIMISFLIFSMWLCASLWVRRWRIPRERRPLIDLFISWNAMYFGAATFEGIMLGRSSFPQMMVLTMGGIGVWLVDEARSARMGAAVAEPSGDDWTELPAVVDENLADEYGFDAVANPADYAQGRTA